MVEFQVDIEALGQLAYRLAVIHVALAAAKSDFVAASGVVASPVVASALGSFCAGWHGGRNAIEGEVSSLSAAAAGVAADYLHGETTLTGTFQRATDGAATGPRSWTDGNGVR